MKSDENRLLIWLFFGLTVGPVASLLAIGIGYVIFASTVCDPLYSSNSGEAGWGEYLRGREIILLERAQIDREAPIMNLSPEPRLWAGPC